MDRDTWIIVVSLVLGVGLFAYVLGDIPLGETISLLDNVKLHYVLIYLAVSVGRQMAFTQVWNIILKSQGENLPYLTLLNYRIVDYTISFLTPGPKVGGEFTRSGLMEKHDIDYSKGLSSTVIDKTMEIFSNAMFLMVGMIVITPFVDVPQFWEIVFWTISIVFIGFIGTFFYGMSKDKSVFQYLFRKLRLHQFQSLGKLEKGIVKFENHLHDFYSKSKKAFILSFLTAMPTWIMSLIEFKYLTLMLGFDFNWAQLFLISQFVGAVYLIPVPLGLGTLEVSQITVFALFNKDTKGGVMVALLTRVRGLLLSAWGLTSLGYYGFEVRQVFEKYASKGKNFWDKIRENGLF